jgi:hypothetical protein
MLDKENQMSDPNTIDGVLMTWGDRLFYLGNRSVKARPEPRLSGRTRPSAATIRERIAATVVRRAPQVMVKVTGGGRGMKAIAAHMRYISKNGRLTIEDEQGRKVHGRDALREIEDDWRFGGSRIADTSPRREAFNIMLSMPSGTDGQIVLRAAREFAVAEFGEHKYAMVLHEHQANPHVHLCVRAESNLGRRLNPRKADLQRWRETFAEKLRGWGIDAEATRQFVRGEQRIWDPIWRVKAKEEGRLRLSRRADRRQPGASSAARDQAKEAWQRMAHALSRSSDGQDRELVRAIGQFEDRQLTPNQKVDPGRAEVTALQDRSHGR